MKWTGLMILALLLFLAGCHHRSQDQIPALEDQVQEIMEWATGNADFAVGETAENGSVNFYLLYVEEMFVKVRAMCVYLETVHGYDCQLPDPPSGTNPPQNRPPEF